MSNDQQTVKQIRQIIKSEYDYWATFNDKLKSGRKIKCMKNGYIPPQKELDTIDRAINKKLTKAGITVKSAGWEGCLSYWGGYVAYIVRI